jgi:hypothetical protein
VEVPLAPRLVRTFLASYLNRVALCDSVLFHAGGSNNRGGTLPFLIRLNAACEQFPFPNSEIEGAVLLLQN